MEDKEFNLCKRKCKSFLKKDRYGRMVGIEIAECLERVFREGYKLGVSKKIREVENGR